MNEGETCPLAGIIKKGILVSYPEACVEAGCAHAREEKCTPGLVSLSFQLHGENEEEGMNATWVCENKRTYNIDVGGVGYWVTDYSSCGGSETRARKWEVLVFYAYQSAGSPRQSALVGRGYETFEEAKRACAEDMRKRAAQLLAAANL